MPMTRRAKEFDRLLSLILTQITGHQRSGRVTVPEGRLLATVDRANLDVSVGSVVEVIIPMRVGLKGRLDGYNAKLERRI